MSAENDPDPNWLEPSIDEASGKVALPETPNRSKKRQDKQLALLKQQIAQRKDVEEALRRESAIVSLLQEIASAANTATSSEDVFRLALERICAHTGWPLGHVYVLSPDREVVVSRHISHCTDEARFGFLSEHIEAVRFAPGADWVLQVFGNGKPALLVDISQEPGFECIPELAEAGIKSAFAYPVLAGSEVVATLFFFSLDAGELDEGLSQVMDNVCAQLSLVVERERASESSQRSQSMLALQARQLKALNEMGQLVVSTLDLDVVFERVLAALRPLLDAEGVFILLFEGEELVFAASDEIDGANIKGLRLPATDGVAGEVVHTGQAIWVHGEEMRWRLSPRFEELVGHRLQALLAAPLRIQDRLIGVMEAVHSQPDAFDAEDLLLLEAAASWVAIALQNARLFDQARISRQRLGALARRVVTAQEEERLRISRELHDEAGQTLIVLKLDLETTRDSLPPELRAAHQQLSEAISLTEDLMEHLRLLARDLRPQALDSLGLNQALDGLCQDFARRAQLTIHYTGLDLPKLPDAAAISFYRTLQEALTNVVKHAGANQVQVELGLAEETVFLSIVDDGNGFSVEESLLYPQKPGGVGLVGMQERFELLGGWVQIDSRLSEGTQVKAFVPLEARQEEKTT